MSEPTAQQQQQQPQNGKERSKSTEEKEIPREPALVCKDINIKTELECLVKLLDGKIYKEEEVAMEELHQYLIEDDGSWALGDNFLVFVQRVLRDSQAFSPDTRIHMIRTLAYAALKDDVIIILHQDRRDHTLMNFAQDIDKHTPEEQQAWAMFTCNLFENVGPSEWLLYISEWEYNGQTISNIRVTTKVAVHCILSNCPQLKNIGSMILYNIAIKEVKTVFDDVAVELAMAILQFFQSSPNEDQIFRTLKALARFLEVSPDVQMIIQMIGPHPKQFAGKSERVDELIKIISRKVPA
ncbi:hypothetical protein ACLKA7_011477 [Drosophila subpalustris]